MSTVPSVTRGDGARMPRLGLGVQQVPMRDLELIFRLAVAGWSGEAT